MSGLDLDELLKLASLATETPWSVHDYSEVVGPSGQWVAEPLDIGRPAKSRANAAYIVAAANAVPALVAEVRRLRPVADAVTALQVAQHKAPSENPDHVQDAENALLDAAQAAGLIPKRDDDRPADTELIAALRAAGEAPDTYPPAPSALDWAAVRAERDRLREVVAKREREVDRLRAEVERLTTETEQLTAEPTGPDAAARDADRDVWTRGNDGLWRFGNAKPRPWDRLVEDWGPMYRVGKSSAAGTAGA